MADNAPKPLSITPTAPSNDPQAPATPPAQPASTQLAPAQAQVSSQMADSQGLSPSDMQVPLNQEGKHLKQKDMKGYRKYTTNPDTKKFGFRVTHALYEAMWEAYRDGKRSALELHLTFGVGKNCADTVVNRGYPKKGWLSFKERARMHDRQMHDLQQKAAAEHALKQNDVWEKAKDENLKYLQVARAATNQLMMKTLEALRDTKFTRTRKTLDKNGNVITTEVPCNATDLVRALKAEVETAEIVSKMQSFWLGGPTDRSEINVRQRGLMSLTEEQLKHIIDTNGQLPADLPEEALLALLGAAQAPPGDPSAN